MVMKFFVGDHLLMIIEIDMDKNSIVQLIDDNNRIETNEYVENMLLYHQQIKRSATKQLDLLVCFIKLKRK
jgi:hypothetical protein